MSKLPFMFLVTGHQIATSDDPVWRHRLDQLFKQVLRDAGAWASNPAVSTDFPFTPFICSDPRPPMRFIISSTVALNSKEPWDIIEWTSAAIKVWISDRRCAFDTTLAPDFIIEVHWPGATSNRIITTYFPT